MQELQVQVAEIRAATAISILSQTEKIQNSQSTDSDLRIVKFKKLSNLFIFNRN